MNPTTNSMAKAVFLSGTSFYATSIAADAARHGFSFEVFKRIMNRAGIQLLHEGIDCRTDHEKAEALRRGMAELS